MDQVKRLVNNVSNQIDAIKKLYAKKKSYKIPSKPKEGQEQVDLEITPLALDDMEALNMQENMPTSELAKNARVLFSKSLGVTEDIVKDISFEYMEDLLIAIMDANNFKEEDLKKTGIKEFIARKARASKITGPNSNFIF